MFKIRIIYFCLLASIFICSNALPAEKKTGSNFQLHGQVFIVTKGQQTFKLPLVQVFAVPEAIISKVIASRTSNRNEIRSNLSPQLIENKLVLVQAEEEIAQQRKINDPVALSHQVVEYCKGFTRYSNEWVKCMSSTELTELKSRTDEASKSMQPYYDRRNTAYHKYEDLNAVYKIQRDAFKFFDDFESDISTASKIVKTDADGNFSLANLQGKRIALFARAKRQVVGETEDYIWLVWADKTNPNIMLSNDNLIESQCSECIKFLEGIKE